MLKVTQIMVKLLKKSKRTSYFRNLKFSKYKLRMESKGKKVKSGGGFGETGFKYAEAEDQYTTEKKKYQKAALGLQVRIFLQ